MKKDLLQKIAIPEGVEVDIQNATIQVKGKEGEMQKVLHKGKIDVQKKEQAIYLTSKQSTKREKKLMNTLKAHITNMIKGVEEKFLYRLKICFSHFPISVEVKGNVAEIKNFLGEKVSRKVAIPQGVEVQTDKQFITILSVDKECAGQAAANFERATKIKGRDRRIFQDGIYIVEKAGREL